MNSNSEQTIKQEVAVFGGGCFWCTDAVFTELSGVTNVVPGYAGGTLENPTYKDVCSGETGHAEVVKITFDPTKINYEKLLDVFFKTHDPTTLNRQGADVGTQYRSVIFFTSEEQEKSAKKIISKLNTEKEFSKKIITEVQKLPVFFEAEKYHDDYFKNNPQNSYCQFVIKPKVDKLKSIFSSFIEK